MCGSVAEGIVRDNTDCWISGVAYAVGSSGQWMASSVPNLLELLAQVFPEQRQGTINTSVSLSMGAMKICY